ncbi:hypothetical protein TNCV_610211 [Trichonephila clavipes]|nr:hypothetical protein TNCV_610211 [Trichonephila clavipes]
MGSFPTVHTISSVMIRVNVQEGLKFPTESNRAWLPKARIHPCRNVARDKTIVLDYDPGGYTNPSFMRTKVFVKKVLSGLTSIDLHSVPLGIFKMKVSTNCDTLYDE